MVFVFFSLASFSPDDLSRSPADTSSGMQNIFGISGAWAAYVLFRLFGMGSFWIPVILFYVGINFPSDDGPDYIEQAQQASGSLLLVIATGGMFNTSSVFGERFSEGSIISGTIQELLFRYAHPAGGYLILVSVFLVGFILVSRMTILRILFRIGFYSVLSVRAFLLAMISLVKSGIKKIFCFYDDSMAWMKKRKELAIQEASLPRLPEPVSASEAPAVRKSEESRPPVYNPEVEKAVSFTVIPENQEKQEHVKPLETVVEPVQEKNIRNVRQNDPPAPVSMPETDITIRDERPKPAKIPDQIKFDIERPFARKEGFELPPISLLDDPKIDENNIIDEDFLRNQSRLLEEKLGDFGVQGKVVTVLPGPVVTTFEYQPAPGVKISRVVNLSDDLALALRALSIRIVAPIPGKGAIGIEVPNDKREMVSFKEMVVSPAFHKIKSKLAVCLGKDIVGNPVAVELDKMPHLLIAGATGAGKSVGLNVMITSLLFKATPDDVKLIMIDPKRIELSVYDGIPHLITPVVTDMKKATNALYWAVREMEARYQLLADHKVRNISQFNRKAEKLKEEDPEQYADLEPLPYIVIIIDELADLMMVASKEVEVAIARLAQMARASGMHLVIATQRPSVDVLTGMIKANFPTRMSFQVSCKIDSRTIIDTNGAEQLLGNGDMLYLPPGTAKLQRIHGAYISEDEVLRVIEYLKEQQAPEYIEDVIQGSDSQGKGEVDSSDYDEKYDEAVALVVKQRQASISMVQRHLRIGYNRAARIIEIMERDGVVGPSDGAKPREVLISAYGLSGGEDAA